MADEIPPTPNSAQSSALNSMRVFRAVLVAMAAVGLALITWRLTDLLLLLFACALVAMMFQDFTGWLMQRLKLPFALALSLAVVFPIAVIIVSFTLFGQVLGAQFAELATRLPAATAAVEAWLQGTAWGRSALGRVNDLVPDGGSVVAFAQSAVSNIGTALSALGVILVGGIYLAAQPTLYTRGVLGLVPPGARSEWVRIYKAIVANLNAWVKGQALGMVFVGLGMGIGLSIVGLPGAPAIGLVAGLCEFVPYLGAIVIVIPALVLGFAQGSETGLWVLAVLLIVQQVQGNVVSPIVQSRMVDIPPALTIFSLIAAGVLMGPLGVILAVPLTVVGLVLIRELVDHSAVTLVE
jgi:predicted PurR-regulated permease PerM